ncbi:MAG: hypothetical protein AAF085_07530 [Planctomycetota bacterium]
MPNTQEQKNKPPKDQLCGACGYPVRGISELVCPECGADLRVVGTTSGPKHQGLRILLASFLFSAALLVLAIPLFYAAEGVFPQHRDWSLSVQGNPHSGEFEEVQFGLKATTVVPNKNTAPFGVSGNTTYTNNKPVGNLTVTKAATSANVYDVWMVINPKQSSPSAAYGWSFNIDPVTGQADWMDAKTKTNQTSSGRFSDQDLLAMLKSLDADTTNPDLLIEAKAITDMANTLVNAVNSTSPTATVNVDNIAFWAYGSGGSVTPGPPWFMPTYIVGWILVWAIGLFCIVRRMRKAAGK